VTNAEQVAAIQWHSWTCVLGSEVNGIWPKYSQINDVNAADASLANSVIATGDDNGLVKLLRFPCVKKGIVKNNMGFNNIAVFFPQINEAVRP